MNQGRPAAGIASPRAIGAYRSAARSIRLRRYVVVTRLQSQPSFGARASQVARSSCCSAVVRRGRRASCSRTSSPSGPQTRATDPQGRRPLPVSLPPGRCRSARRSSTGRRLAGGDHRLPVELLPAVAEPQTAVLDTPVEPTHRLSFSPTCLISNRSAKSLATSSRTVNSTSSRSWLSTVSPSSKPPPVMDRSGSPRPWRPRSGWARRAPGRSECEVRPVRRWRARAAAPR